MTDFDDRTLVAPTSLGAAAESVPFDSSTLQVGTRLGEFEITQVLGVGGFGIVYLARDHSLRRDVALKEYMPSALARRVDSINVSARSSSSAETFEAGLRSFVNEARMLAMFDHPSLVKVYRFWESNGTAYTVMPFYEGKTLKQVLSDKTVQPTEDWLKRLLAPLLDALEIVHSKHCFHRDIAPDNIFVLSDGKPVLIDFGAARQVIGDMGSNLTVILKHGYAPLEQYAGDPTMPQGAWTDLYALGAVLHYSITGTAPIPSVGRMIKDAYEPLAKRYAGHYSEPFLRAIDDALAVRSDQRPQSVAEFRSRLGFDQTAATYSGTTGLPPAQQASVPASSVRPAWLWAGMGALVALGLIGLGWSVIDNQRSPISPEAQAPKPISPPVAAEVAQVPLAESAPQVSTQSNTAAVLPEVATATFEPVLLLEQAYQARELEHVVTVQVRRARLQIGRDRFGFQIESNKGGYVYVLMLGTHNELSLLFPNALDRQNRIRPGKALALPRSQWAMQSAGPAGVNHLLVLVSPNRRDFSSAGLHGSASFGEFPLDKLWQQHIASPTGPSLLAGMPRCDKTAVAGSANECDASYGAALFQIEELATAPAS